MSSLEMSSLEIRPAAAADLPSITEIYEHAVRFGTATFELTAPDLSEMTRRFDALTADGFPFLVAVIDGRAVGYDYAGAYRTRPAYRFTVEDSIYLAPDAQGKGIGRALLEALVAACTAKGYRLMLAVIGDSAQYASIRLHRSVGFTFCGTLHSVGYKFDRWLDSVVMELPLGDGDHSKPAELAKG